MYTVKIYTEDDEAFSFRQDSRALRGNVVCAIADKIICVQGYEMFTFDIVEYHPSRLDISSVKSPCRKVRIIEIQLDGSPVLERNVNRDLYMDIIFVMDGPSTMHIDNNEETFALYDNYTSLEHGRRRKTIYVDLLYSSMVDLFILLKNKINLLSYGIIVENDNNNKSKTISRIVMVLSQSSLRFIYENVKNIFLLNIRFNVDYKKPGSVVLFMNKNDLLHYFQLVCCTNTNEKIKHSLDSFDDDYGIVKQKIVHK